MDAVTGQFPDAWRGDDPQQSKYIQLKRSLVTVRYWLHEFQRPFRGFKMPMDCEEQDQHDDPADVKSWNEAEGEIHRLGDELKDHIDLRTANAASTAAGVMGIHQTLASPQAVLQATAELRQWAGELGKVASTLSDFAFKWAERNGGVPKTKAAREKLLGDYRARFLQQATASEEQFVQALEERYQAWAKDRSIETATPVDLQRFDDETGLLTRRVDELSGFIGPKDLAHRIGARCDELSRAAVMLGCNDATVAALKGMAALTPDIAEGRAVLSVPATWTEARRQSNEIFKSEAIAGVGLNRAWEVALERLEHAAAKALEAADEYTEPSLTIRPPTPPTAGVAFTNDDPAHLTEAERTIIKRLGESSILLKGPDAYADVAERTGKDALKRLESIGIVERPRGKKRGYALTERGRGVHLELFGSAAA